MICLTVAVSVLLLPVMAFNKSRHGTLNLSPDYAEVEIGRAHV